MELLAQRLDPIPPAKATRAIARFLERCAPLDGAPDGDLSADVRGQLDAMRAALQRSTDEAAGGPSGALRKAAADKATGDGGAGGGGGGGAAAAAAATAAPASSSSHKHKKPRREE